MTSRVKVDKLVSLHQRLVRRRVAQVKDDVLYRVMLEFLSRFSAVEPA